MTVTPAAPTAAAVQVDLSHVRYHIDASVSGRIRLKLENLLLACSARQCRRQNAQTPNDQSMLDDGEGAFTGSLDVQHVTHIITTTTTFEDHRRVDAYNAHVIEQAKAEGRTADTAPSAAGQRGELIAVVTPKWLTRSWDLKKRQEEQYYSADPKQIFSGIIVATEDLPPGDSETIKGVVSALGGQYRQALVVEITHLFCTKPSGKKYERLMASGWKLGMKAVLPHWFDDCLRLHARVPEDEYAFPEPPVLNFDVQNLDSKPWIDRLRQKLGLQTLSVLPNTTSQLLEPHVLAERQHTRAYLDALSRRPADSAKAKSGVLSGKKVYIAESCEITEERIKAYVDRIREAGSIFGETSTVPQRLTSFIAADIVVVKARDGWEYWKAYELGKMIGNLDWLVYVLFGQLESNTLPSPLDRIMHYPPPKMPLSDFANDVITVSGYVGSTRDNLKRIIELLGAKFEGNMTKDKTTHVIAAVRNGSKVQHAQQWGIPVVNHLWIEDCLISWLKKQVATHAYTHYSERRPGFSYADLVGNRRMPAKEIDAWAERPEILPERQAAISRFGELVLKNPPTISVEDAVMQLADETAETPEEAEIELPADLDMPEEHPSPTPTPQNQPQIVASMPDTPAATSVPQIFLPTPDTLARKISKEPSPHLPKEPSRPGRGALGIAQHTVTSETTISSNSAPASSTTENSKEADIVAAELLEQPRPNLKRKSSSIAADEDTTPLQAKPRLQPPPVLTTSSEADPTPAPTQAARKATKRKTQLDELRASPHYTPRMSMGRKAAENAARKLHEEIMPDANAFAAEQQGSGKRRLDAMFGGLSEVRSSPKRQGSVAAAPKRRGKAAAEVDEESSETEGVSSEANYNNAPPLVPFPSLNGAQNGNGNGKVRGRLGQLKATGSLVQDLTSQVNGGHAGPMTSTPNKTKSKVVLSGQVVKIATTGVALDDATRRALTNKLGAKLLDEKIDGVTHLVVKGISRTVKFLTAICHGAIFVTEQWALDSVKQGQFLDETPYAPQDKEGENKHGMTLAFTLKKARRSKIFDEHTFYLTPNVQPPYESLRVIAEAGGAKVLKKVPTAKQLQDKADAHVITALEDRDSWRALEANRIPVYTGEAIIKAVLHQRLELDKYEIDL